MNPAVASMPFKESMEYLASPKIDCVELGAGRYPGDAHIKPAELIGNPIHPNKKTAEKFHNEFKDAILVAELLDVDIIIGFLEL